MWSASTPVDAVLFGLLKCTGEGKLYILLIHSCETFYDMWKVCSTIFYFLAFSLYYQYGRAKLRNDHFESLNMYTENIEKKKNDNKIFVEYPSALKQYTNLSTTRLLQHRFETFMDHTILKARMKLF